MILLSKIWPTIAHMLQLENCWTPEQGRRMSTDYVFRIDIEILSPVDCHPPLLPIDPAYSNLYQRGRTQSRILMERAQDSIQ